MVLEKLVTRKDQLQKLKAEIETLTTDIVDDLKAVGVEFKSVEDIANALVDAADDVTSSGLLEPIDGPIAKSMIGKLLKTRWGKSVESWYQSLRKKILG